MEVSYKLRKGVVPIIIGLIGIIGCLGIMYHDGAFCVRQKIEKNRHFDPVDTSGFDMLDKPYVLHTIYHSKVIKDYGTFKEIDSLKCLRITDIKRLVTVTDSIDEVASVELELLDKPCNK